MRVGARWIASQVLDAVGPVVRSVHAGPCWDGCARPEHRTVKVSTPETQSRADKRQALAIFRAVLDDWVRTARENHEALGHRGEIPGEECWKNFHVSDVRSMINDTARELGLEPFPVPATGTAEEDKR
jgi:hypothetical protein